MKRLLLVVISFLALVSSLPANALIRSATLVTSPNAPDGLNTSLASVSCVSSEICVAVGGFENIREFSQTFITTWDGATWSSRQSPNTATDHWNRLVDVDCVSSSFCMSVGSYWESDNRTLAMSWNGSAWSLLSTLNTAGRLSSVSCLSSAMCMAVGTMSGNTSPFMKWNGTAWSSIPAPVMPAGSIVQSVSCVSATFCIAVGYVYRSTFSGMEGGTLTLKWDGTSWSVVSAPMASTLDLTLLNAVDCFSEISCVAVGSYRPDTGSPQAPLVSLVLIWDGIAWSKIPDPVATSTGSVDLSDISCGSSQHCVAVGQVGRTPWVISMQESSWTEITIPTASGSQRPSGIAGISCSNASNCVGVGSREDPMDVFRTTAFILGPDVLSATKPSVVPPPAPVDSTPSVLTSPAPSITHFTARRKQTVTSSKLTKSAGLVVPKGSKVSLSVSSKQKKVCKVVGTSVKTIAKGTCSVKVVVMTKSKKKTSKTVTIKVS